MEINNQIVMHKKYGEGKVVSCSDNFILVRFADGEKKFIYPGAFKVSLVAVDPIVQASIIEEINKMEVPIIDLPQGEPERKAALFYVFQGNTFIQECRGGYLWAPITNNSGSNIHHWNRLLDVREGNIILHGCDGKVVAISIAKGPCYDFQQPEELRTEELWDKEGRRVDCEYYLVRSPITTADYKDEIIKLSAAKYSPFNRDGNGNMGYLYEINKELAHLFINETIRANKYLEENTAIRNFLKTIDLGLKN